MKTLVLPRFGNFDSARMWRAARDAGWQTYDLPIDLSCPKFEGQVAAYGDGRTARHAAEANDLELVAPPADWLLTLPKTYVQREIEAVRYNELEKSSTPRFIKCADIKWFYPTVYVDEVPSKHREMPEDELVLVQEPVEWLYEFRYFILDREIRTSCQYKLMGVPSSDPGGGWVTQPWNERDAREFLDIFMLENVEIPEATVIDVGFIKDRGWAIVEANPAYGSGIYDCNPRQVLEVVERACVQR